MTTVTLFEHSDFGGESLPLTSSDPDLSNDLMDKSLKSWNDQVSSFTIQDYGASGNVWFYGDIQYGEGDWWTQVDKWSHPIAATGDKTYGKLPEGFDNNELSSVDIPSGVVVTLYEEEDFKGSHLTLDYSDPDLTDDTLHPTWDNQVSSIKVEGGSARFYAEPDYNRGILFFPRSAELHPSRGQDDYRWVEDLPEDQSIPNDSLSSVMLL